MRAWTINLRTIAMMPGEATFEASAWPMPRRYHAAPRPVALTGRMEDMIADELNAFTRRDDSYAVRTPGDSEHAAHATRFAMELCGDMIRAGGRLPRAAREWLRAVETDLIHRAVGLVAHDLATTPIPHFPSGHDASGPDDLSFDPNWELVLHMRDASESVVLAARYALTPRDIDLTAPEFARLERSVKAADHVLFGFASEEDTLASLGSRACLAVATGWINEIDFGGA